MISNFEPLHISCLYAIVDDRVDYVYSMFVNAYDCVIGNILCVIFCVFKASFWLRVSKFVNVGELW